MPSPIKESRWADEIRVDLSGVDSLDDPTLQLVRGLDATSHFPSSLLSHVVFQLDGTLAEHPQSLRTPGKGDAHDPRTVLPDLVTEVAAELGVSAEAATYYLQLLTLAEPSDRNVRAWNGWKTKQITDAGAELLAKELVVEGKRERAGRSFFLPGGWTKVLNGLPMETWKLEPYRGHVPEGESQAWLDLVRPLAPRPLELMFAAAWERSRGDDGPGFEELRTTRRRRR